MHPPGNEWIFLREIRIGTGFRRGEFYFLTPADLVKTTEVPPDCGLIEAGFAEPDAWRNILRRQVGFFHYDLATRAYCVLTIPAPWRDTPAPTWQLLAAMLRHQRRELLERPPEPPSQQKIEFI